MADFTKTFGLFKGIEFSNNSNILHKNKGENGLTYYGIYQSAHPTLPLWSLVEANVQDTNDLEVSSKYLSQIESVQEEVRSFYLNNYFLPLKLDVVKHQLIANEMFYFAINQGSLRRTVKYAQCVAGKLTCDGVLGTKTVNRLNELTEKELKRFDVEYDKREIGFYFSLKSKRKFNWWLRYIKGWVYRAIKI